MNTSQRIANRRRCWLTGSLLTWGLFLHASTSSMSIAHANPMDLAPERLVNCTPKDNGAGGTIPCGAILSVDQYNYYKPDNNAWAKLMSQYGTAIAPPLLRPGRTTGYSGFEMSLFGVMTTMSSGESFLKNGTEGAISGGRFPKQNSSPDGLLQHYGVQGRKGLPFGFELQGSVGYIAQTELVTFGGGIRFSPLEGFRKGWQAIIPDFSVGGYVNTLTGTNKVKLTVPSLDVQLSKVIVAGSSVVFQPYLAWQMLWIIADSGVVDATPGVDAIGGCNARPSTQAERTDATGDRGDLRCQNKPVQGQPTSDITDVNSPASLSRLDVNNNMVFNAIRFTRQRALIGFAFRYEHLHITMQTAFDLTSPETGGNERIKGLDRQFSFAFATGLTW